MKLFKAILSLGSSIIQILLVVAMLVSFYQQELPEAAMMFGMLVLLILSDIREAVAK